MKTIILKIIILSAFIPVLNAFSSPPLSYEGRRLYVSYCQLCHGEKGKGKGALAREMELKITDLTTS